MNAGPGADWHLDLTLGPGPDGRMAILSRHVRWPWSLPRGFHLHGAAGPLTLLPQATAAAMLPGDLWRHRIRVAEGAARVISAGAMAIHAGPGRTGFAKAVAEAGPGGAAPSAVQDPQPGGGPPDASRAEWHLRVGPGARLAILPDPAVLFAGARGAQAITAEVAEGGRLVLLDGFCRRDPAAPPAGGGWESDLLIRRPGGAVILRDRQRAGEDLLAELTRLPGAPAAFGTLIAVGVAPFPAGPWEAPGVWGAAAELRGGAGQILRLAAVSGGALAAAFERIRAALSP